jgi:phosphoribosylformimino-5-aminoimidazole carboxamide ribonucleotide (ProFAR) isomerase
MRLIDFDVPSGGAKLVPSLAVRKGSPVWVKDGKYHPFRIEGINVPAREIFSLLSTRFDTVHFMDLDGISEREPDLELLKDICSGKTAVAADLGVPYSDMVIDVIMAGAADAVVSTKTIGSLDEIASSYELTENLILELVLEGMTISAQDPEMSGMDPAAFVKEMVVLGVKRILLVQTDPLGTDIGRSVDIVRKALPKDGELWVDIGSLEDIPVMSGKADALVLSASRMVGGLD